LALAQAGHLRADKGEHERALALYEEAYALSRDGAGWLVACIAGQLFALNRETEAHESIAALRRHLHEHPEDDAFAYAEMADLLCEVDEPAAALEWCQEGIARYHPDYRPGAAGVELDVVANRLWSTRREIREQLGYAPDEADLAVDAHMADVLAGLRALAAAIGDEEDEDDALEEPFNAMVLYWSQEDFRIARERWPSATMSYSDDYATYCRRIENTARRFSTRGAARVVLVRGNVTDYEAYAARTGKNPAEMDTRTAYGTSLAEHRPEATLAWPPPRNDRCWCASGKKYKKCCGDPRHR